MKNFKKRKRHKIDNKIMITLIQQLMYALLKLLISRIEHGLEYGLTDYDTITSLAYNFLCTHIAIKVNIILIIKLELKLSWYILEITKVLLYPYTVRDYYQSQLVRVEIQLVLSYNNMPLFLPLPMCDGINLKEIAIGSQLKLLRPTV